MHGGRPVHGLLETHQEAREDGQEHRQQQLGRVRAASPALPPPAPPNRGDTAQATAAMVSTLPRTRIPVTDFLPAGPMPEPVHQQPAQRLPGDRGHGEQGHAEQAHGEGLGKDEERADAAGQDVDAAETAVPGRPAGSGPARARPLGRTSETTIISDQSRGEAHHGGGDAVVQAGARAHR